MSTIKKFLISRVSYYKRLGSNGPIILSNSLINFVSQCAKISRDKYTLITDLFHTRIPRTVFRKISHLAPFLLLLCFNANFTRGQSKQESKYVLEKDEAPIKGVKFIDQSIWYPQPNNASYLTVKWRWENSVDLGGYMGLEKYKGAYQNIVFSEWSATDAKGANCKKIDDTKTGYSCFLPIKLKLNKSYSYNLWRLETTSDGQWWGSWLVETNDEGISKKYFVGKIKTSLKHQNINEASIVKAEEYWGKAAGQGNEIP